MKMREFPRSLALLASALIGACGDGQAPPEEIAWGNEKGAYFRLTITGPASSAKIDNVELVEGIRSKFIPALDPELVIVSYRGSRVFEAQPVRFSTEMIAEGGSGTTRLRSTEIVTDPRETIFLGAHPEIDKIVLLGGDGKPLAELAGTSLPTSRRTSGFSRRESGLKLTGDYKHIEVLEAGQENKVTSAFWTSGKIEKLVTPVEGQIGRLLQGLALATGDTVQAVRTVGIARFVNGGKVGSQYYWGFAHGSAILLNVDLLGEPDMLGHIVHEAAHCFTFLLDAGAGRDFSGWDPDVAKAVLKVLDQYRLYPQFRKLWKDMHQTAVTVKLATDYYIGPADDNAAVNEGFPTAYGASLATEEIAELVRTILYPGNWSGICGRFAGKTQLTDELAIIYAKLHLLKGVGMIRDADLSRCAGGIKLDAKAGIHLSNVMSFTEKQQGGHATYEGHPYLAAMAYRSDSYGALVKIRSPKGTALGLHRLDPALLVYATYLPSNQVLITHDVEMYARAAGGGLVLITEDSKTAVTGAIFFLSLENSLGQVTDTLPVSTFHIPL